MAHQPHPSGGLIVSELVQHDPDFANLVTEFVDGLGTRLQKLEQAARSSDLHQLRTSAHQLKGAAGGYGYPLLTEVAARLEQQAATEALDECATTVKELKNLISRVVVSD